MHIAYFQDFDIISPLQILSSPKNKEIGNNTNLRMKREH